MSSKTWFKFFDKKFKSCFIAPNALKFHVFFAQNILKKLLSIHENSFQDLSTYYGYKMAKTPSIVIENAQNKVFFTLGVEMAGLENANFYLNPGRYQFQCFLMMCAGRKDASLEGWMPCVGVGVGEICANFLCMQHSLAILPPKCGSFEGEHFGSVWLGYPGELQAD